MGKDLTLTKAGIAEELHAQLGFNKREAMEVVQAFFDEIAETLVTNEKVGLSGFGSFELRDKRERPGRNPKTGDIVMVSARRVVTFRSGQKLRNLVDKHVAGS